MNNKYLLLLALPFFYCIQSCNNQQNSKTDKQDGKVDSTGLVFIKNVDELSQAEIKAATAAETISKNPRVANFAHKLIKDYNDSQQKLQDVKANASITTASEISAADKKMIDSISKLSGAKFDQAFMNFVTAGNSGQIVIRFINATQEKSTAIGVFARNAIPVMQVHLDSARKIAASLK